MKRALGIIIVLAWTVTADAQTAPPIPHPIDGYLVTKQENSCLECHDQPKEIGKKQAKGMPPPAPASHYASSSGKQAIAEAHFTCTSCHKPK